MTEFSTSQESQFSASQEQYNSSPIDLARMGAYVRTTADSTQTVPNAAWITDLTNNTTNPSFSFSGVVSEVIVFNRKLSEEERQIVYGYLSRKYALETKLPDGFQQSHNSAYSVNAPYWNIEHHPNTNDLETIKPGSEFSGIELNNFLSLSQTTYKSAGTRLFDGTILSGDTYDTQGS
jgi:hypothetical protein